MSDKEKKIKAAFDGVIEALMTPSTGSIYEAIMMQNKAVKLLNDLYEAGRVEGELSKIKEN